MSFVLKLLGTAKLESAGQPVRGRASHRRRLGLLALLAVPPARSSTRERLVAVLWPDSAPDAGRHLLAESLYVLRRELGEGAIQAAGEDLALSSELVRCDAVEFELAVARGDLADAVALYGGPFLDGWYVEDAPDFERWAAVERDRLERLYVRAVEELAAGAPVEESVRWWRQLWTCDPLSSRYTLGLMRALIAAGEPAAAFRTGEAHINLVRGDLGVQPHPEVLSEMEMLRTARELPSESAEPVPRPAVPEPPSPGAESLSEPASSPPSHPVGTDAESTNPAPAALLAPGSAEVSEPGSTGPDVPKAGERLPTRLAIGVAASVLLAVLVWTIGGRGDAAGAAVTALDPRRVAVLYFDDHSKNGELAYFASGLTESLIHQLSQVEALEVVSRNGVKPFRRGDLSLDSIARLLRTGSVVEGSVQRSGQRVRVRVQLVDAETGAPLDSRELERPMGDLFALEDDVTREVAAFLRSRLGQAIHLRERKAATSDARARELVLRAESLREDAVRLAREPNLMDARSALGLLEQADSLLAAAESRDPRWADPSVLRGWIALERGNLLGGGQPRARTYPVALGHAARALRVDPRHASALELRGTVRWRMATASADAPGADTLVAGAGDDLRAAVANDPLLASAWSTLSQYLRGQGAFAESYVAVRHALEADAYFAEQDEIKERLYRSALALDRFDEARRWCVEGAREFPEDFRFVECELTLAARDGSRPPDVAGARRAVAALEEIDPRDKARLAGRGYNVVYRQAMLAAVLARAGQNDSARAVLARARAEAGGNRDWRVFFLTDEAYVRLRMGDRDGALTNVEAFLRARPFLRSFVARDPQFRELRAEPRFVAATTPPLRSPRSSP